MIDIERFINDVRAFEGVPYHHQGRNEHGIDCIGLVIAALAKQGIDVKAPANYGRSPRGSLLTDLIEQSGLVYKLPIDLRKLGPRRGDVLIFTIRDDPQHVGVALSPTTMIHAAAASKFVREVPISEGWRSKLTDIFRWKD